MLLAVGACKHASRVPTTALSPTVPAVVRTLAVDPSARVYYNDGAALRDSVRLVVRDAARWTDLWRQINAGDASPPPLPQIDFTREMLLVAAAGRMSPGDQIKIDSIAEAAATISVVVRTRVECRRFSGESYPLEVIRMATSGKKVVFEDRREKSDCGGW